LLDEDQFRNKVFKYVPGYLLEPSNMRPRQFFSGPLKQFEKTETFTTIRGKKLTRLKNADIIDGEFRSQNLG
jgi:hypothetical protein